MAGTTRDVIETHLNLDGYPVILSDTAGIRDSKDEIERKGIKLSLKNANEADLNIIVLEPKSVNFHNFLRALSHDNNIIVVNKLDVIGDKINEEIRKLNPISISVKENKNIDLLIKETNSTLFTLYPIFVILEMTSDIKILLSTPFQVSSSLGKNFPISPRPAAPSSASAIACKRASPSE